MKRKLLNYLGAALIISLGLTSCAGSSSDATEETNDENSTEMGEAHSMNINLDGSTVIWKGTMLGVYSHEGTMNFLSGNLDMAGEKITGGSFVVDLKSMSPTDQNYDPAQDHTPEKLVGHLQSLDFFDVASFPTAEFKITGSEDGNLQGNLSVRGITNAETVNNVSFNAANNTWTGTLVFDRKKYDVAWDSEMKDMVLSDDVELTINLSL